MKECGVFIAPSPMMDGLDRFDPRALIKWSRSFYTHLEKTTSHYNILDLLEFSTLFYKYLHFSKKGRPCPVASTVGYTRSVTISAGRRMAKTTTSSSLDKGLTFVTFSDGYDDGYKLGDDAKSFMLGMRNCGYKALKDTIHTAAGQGRPITCLVYTLLLPWASEVARDLHIPSALLWIQPATVLSIYYHYFNGLEDEIISNSEDLSWRIKIPGAPLLSKYDLPSFLVPSISCSDTYSFALPTFKEQLESLDAETNVKVLVNSFDALEPDALKAIHKYDLIAVGPLVPSAFLDGGDPTDESFGGDLFEKSDDYIEWLKSQVASSVVYVSFGSLLRLQKPQMEEIAKGLLDAGRPFLWVIRASEGEKEEKNELSCLEDLEKIGKIVPWCSQMEVLTHPSLGCFVTHCGWNSTLESLSCGVPAVAFPHWTDQGTNAKLIEDVWEMGVRVRFNEDGIVESGEILRCIEEVMDGGERSRELRDNAQKWKGLAREAAEEKGSSTINLMAFFDQVGST